MRLLSLPAITAAITLTTSPVFATGGNAVGGLTLQANFVYGSGGAASTVGFRPATDEPTGAILPIFISTPAARATFSICRR